MRKIAVLCTFIFTLTLLLGVVVVPAQAKKTPNLSPCDLSDNLYSEKVNRGTGYVTYTYFDSVYEFLGQEQYDAGGNLVLDTFDGVCN